MEKIPYNIYIEPIHKALSGFFKLNSFTKIAILVDENTLEHCYSTIKEALPKHTLIQIKSGEENKTLETCTQIWSTLTEEKFDRKSILVNLGGGVIGDMGGFCASTYKRGIAFVQIPTTLLSQVDASVGGKLGIDFSGYKNQIGVFGNPQAVFIDVQFLNTLTKPQFNSGLGEVIKHALIQDAPHFEYLEEHISSLNINAVVERSVEIKKNIVEQDFKELGIRKALNFGHTIGHAIESYLLEKTPILHGEAVAASIICESFISMKLKMLTNSEFERIEKLVDTVFNKIEIMTSDFPTIIDLMRQDKKNINSNINCTLLTGIGSCKVDQFVEENLIIESLTYYISK